MIEQQRTALAQYLRRHLSGEARFDTIARRLYSTDASIYMIEPLGVVIPRTADDVAITLQIAAEMGVPITARGGGTSLSGQSIGPGIVLDFSKYLNNILDLDPAARTVRVQPGVVLDQLNRAAGRHDLQLGPDVATASRATMGGMIGNSSAGARSIVHGKMIDHVLDLDVLLADGSRTRLGPLSADEWLTRGEGRTTEAGILRRVREVVLEHRDEIARRYPPILRRVSGYNLDILCAGLAGIPCGYPGTCVPGAPVGLHHLVVGGEGTLALVTEATLRLVPRPRHRGLLVPKFASLAHAMDALAACLEARPSAVEMMDQLLLELSAGNLAVRDTMRLIGPVPKALFMVEISSDDPAELADRVDRLERRLQGVDGLTGVVRALDASVREPLWDLRRAAMPLLYGIRGDRKPVTFVEDPAVDPVRLPAFIARFRELLQRHGTDGSFYGHASVGCVHVRPLINLKDPDDVARMRRIAEEVADLVLEYGGSLSGEHGDGLVRSEWNEKVFGPVLYRAFCDIKDVFDPRGLLNPGRIVRAPRMTESLRYPPGYAPAELPTVFDYGRQEGFVRAVEMCNGAGVCRKREGGTMCPSFRATLDEEDSTRGRANALRLALSDPDPMQTLRGQDVMHVYDLCLMCKACKAECPSNVDVARLKAELLQLHYQNKRRPLGHHLMAALPWLSRLAAPLAPVANWVQTRRVSRWLLEKLAGIDRRRSLPPLHRRHFRRWFAGHRPDPAAGSRGRVLLLADCFTTWNEPAVGQAAVAVLERAGYAVELADARCCGRILLSKGFLHRARSLVLKQAPRLARQVAGGTPLLGLEPSCLLSFVDEWPDLVPGEETRRIAAASHLADAWLARELGAGRASLPLRPRAGSCVLHGHCHQKALVGTAGTAAALRLVPGLEVKVLDTGCCGMAGSFGFEKEHYDLSVKIAGLSVLPALERAPDATVIAPGTSCRHQIHDLARRRALHPLELLAEQLGPGP